MKQYIISEKDRDTVVAFAKALSKGDPGQFVHRPVFRSSLLEVHTILQGLREVSLKKTKTDEEAPK